MSSSSSPSWAFVLVFLLSLLPLVSSERFIESKSLNPCQKHSKFSASLFNVVFTPENRTVHIDVVGVSAIAGNITAEIEVIAYGYRVLRQSFNPCNVDLPGLCPMSTGQFTLSTNFLDIGDDVIKSVPGKRVPSLFFPLVILTKCASSSSSSSSSSSGGPGSSPRQRPEVADVLAAQGSHTPSRISTVWSASTSTRRAAAIRSPASRPSCQTPRRSSRTVSAGRRPSSPASASSPQP